MKRFMPVFLAALCLAMAGCATKPAPPTLFDLGPMPRTTPAAAATMPALPALAMMEVQTPNWLDGSMMFYRLLYEGQQQPRPYAGSRWSMSPSQLLDQRLRLRITQAGGMVIQTADGASDLPILRVEADDFTQYFSSPGSSEVQVSLRASIVVGRSLVGQKTFVQSAPSSGANAAGGAQALAVASDAAIAELIAWLPTVNLKPPVVQPMSLPISLPTIQPTSRSPNPLPKK